MTETKNVKQVFDEAMDAMNQTIRTFNEQARQLTDRMVTQGRMSRDEGRRLVTELKRQVRMNRLSFENTLSGHMAVLRTRIESSPLRSVNLSSRTQIEELKRKVARLSAEVEKISGWKGTRRRGAEKDN